MPHVYSTLTNDVNYGIYEYDTPLANGHRNARLVRGILVKGGTNVAMPLHKGRGIPYTPIGVRTEVSREDAEILMQDEAFLSHLKHGFVRIESKKTDPEKYAVKMDLKDISRPRTPETDMESKKPVASIN